MGRLACFPGGLRVAPPSRRLSWGVPPAPARAHALSSHRDYLITLIMNAPTLTALITGASGGIGYELAKLFAKDHHNLVLVARNGPRLEQIADELQRQFGITVTTVALDLTEPATPRSLFAQLQSDGIAVDILVNNA